ncbi:MAG: hypothetical protein R3F34_09020 [Planctomycetota bacterium]
MVPASHRRRPLRRSVVAVALALACACGSTPPAATAPESARTPDPQPTPAQSHPSAQPDRRAFLPYWNNFGVGRDFESGGTIQVPLAGQGDVRFPEHTKLYLFRTKVRVGDAIPGVDRARVTELVGRPLVGLQGPGGKRIAPPMFADLQVVDSDHGIAVMYGPTDDVSPVVFVTFSTAEMRPLGVGGDEFGEAFAVARMHSGRSSALDRFWAMGADPRDPERMALVIYDQLGTSLVEHHGLRRPSVDAQLTIRRYGEVVLVASTDVDGKRVALPFDRDGRYLGVVLPEPRWLTYVDHEKEWWIDLDLPKRILVTPEGEEELAIPVATYEDEALGAPLDDPNLYLPLDRAGLPLAMPPDAIGMLRLVEFTSDGSGPTAARAELKVRYSDCHGGWALVRRTSGGLVHEIGGGRAEDVLAAAVAGRLPRYRRWWPVGRHTHLYEWESDPGLDGTRRSYFAAAPPRAVGELESGGFGAIDLQRGVPYPLPNDESSLASAEAVVDALRRREAELARETYQRAWDDEDAYYTALTGLTYEQRVAQAQLRERLDQEFIARVRANGVADWFELARARGIAGSVAWLDAEEARLAAEDAAAEEERRRQASIVDAPTFSWGDVFSAWRIQNANPPKVEVFEDRGLIRIVRY